MSGFAELPGAVLDPDSGTVRQYGSPFGEQRAIAERGALVDLGEIGLIRLTGDDRLSWLDSLTSQRLVGLAPGDSVEDLLLSPQGRIEFQFGVLDDGDSTWLLLDPEPATRLAAWLDRMRFRQRVSVELATGSRRAVATLGEAADAGSATWSDPWARGVAPGGVSYSAVTDDAHPGGRFPLRIQLLDAEAMAGVTDLVRSGRREAAGTAALDALRIAAWRPVARSEVDGRSIPHELDLVRTAVHLDKGCYRGQETIAKVHNLGHPPRRLAQLDLDGSDDRLPEPGSLVYRADDPEGRPVGRVTSAAHHYEQGPIALALLKRSLDPAADLVVAQDDSGARIAARPTTIVRTDAGSAVDIPRWKLPKQ